ncbi:MAG: DUF4058 family protein [Gemmataceae bacterium]|nr:DUF4058 family protein [Gemmataceae bacterium]
MPLLDHFHVPTSNECSWASIHTLWAGAIVGRLNESVLPSMYRAEAQIHIGSRVEADVATFEREPPGSSTSVAPGNGPVATMLAEVWAPPAASLIIPTLFPDELEVQILGSRAGRELVGAIELVSPSNKDRPEARRAFVAKCQSYLEVGIGLIVIDVVADRRANLHDELMRAMDQPEPFYFPGHSSLYAVAYRPARRPGGDQIDCWPMPLTVGQVLPTVPLALRGGPTLPLDLEVTYTEARRRSRL